MNLTNWKGKLKRTFAILLDGSEIFQERPSFRYEIIQKIWEEK